MREINRILEQGIEISGNQIIKILDEVCENGDVIIIKSDGLRTIHKYTAVITSSKNEFDAIRFDSDSLNDAVLKALHEYVKYI